MKKDPKPITKLNTPIDVLLKQLPIFKYCSKDVLINLVAESQQSYFQRGQDIIKLGQQLDNLYIMLDGLVKIFVWNPENTKSICILKYPGNTFGNSGLYHRYIQSFPDISAIALTDVRILSMQYCNLKNKFRRIPALQLGIIENCIGITTSLEERLLDLSEHYVYRRLLNLLLKYAREYNQVLPLSHSDIADLVGTTRETITRLLNQFAEKGLIEKKKNHVHINMMQISDYLNQI